MSLVIPQVRMEIFRGPPKLIDDNFVKGWSFNAVGADGLTGYSFTTDGDIVTINSGSGGLADSWVQYAKAVSGSTDVYKKAIVRARIKTANAGWALIVHYTDDSTDWTGTRADTEFTIVTLSLTAGKTIDYIYVRCHTEDGNEAEVEFDYVAICKDTMLVPVDETKSDIVESLTITLPLLNRGVGGFSCKLPNMNGEYTGKISDFDHVLIYLWRKGATMKKVFGGKILVPGTEGSGSSQEYYLLLSGMDIGQELLVPPKLMKKIYSGTSGKTIIEDAVDLCSEITKKFVDTDNEISSDHDFLFDEVRPHAVITKVSTQAKTIGGMVGFDAYVDPAGNLHVFKRGKYTSSIDLTGKIEHYKKEDDVHRVRNKIKVYGAAEKPWSGAVSRDGWTESTSGWNSSETLGTDSDKPTNEGTVSVQVSKTGGTLASMYREWTSFSAISKNERHRLRLWLKLLASSGNPTNMRISLYAPDATNAFRYYIDKPSKDKWLEYDLPIGPGSVWEEDKIGSPDWSTIGGIWLEFLNDASANIKMRVDLLHFVERFNDDAEDPESQSKYGVRWEEPIIDDSLKSDNECLKKAESLRDFLKDKVTTLSDFKGEGDNGFTPGDRQLVTISNDQINDYFRTLEVRHVLRGVQWDTYLMLSNEPQMVDYVFADLHRELRRLSLSKGKGNPGGGTAGERYMGASRVVCPVGYEGASQWDHSELQAAINDLGPGGESPCPLYAVEKWGFNDIQQAIDNVAAYPVPPPGKSWCIFPFKFPCIFRDT